MTRAAASRLPGVTEGFSGRLGYPFWPPWAAGIFALAIIACDTITGATGGIPAHLTKTTPCPTENCRVEHTEQDRNTARRLAVHLNQATYLARTIMAETPTNHGASIALDPGHQGPVAEFRGLTGKGVHLLGDASQHQRINYISINPATVEIMDDPALLRIMLHEVAHYWWRINGNRGNWLNEWGAIGMEVAAGVHEPPRAPPKCTANWSPSNDPGLHQKAGRCVRNIGEYGLRLAREKYIIQHGATGEATMRSAYRSLYGMAMTKPELTPADVGEHFASRIIDPSDADAVRRAFSRLH